MNHFDIFIEDSLSSPKCLIIGYYNYESIMDYTFILRIYFRRLSIADVLVVVVHVFVSTIYIFL